MHCLDLLGVSRIFSKQGYIAAIKNMNCQFFLLIPQKKIAKMAAKMTMRHSIKQMN